MMMGQRVPRRHQSTGNTTEGLPQIDQSVNQEVSRSQLRNKKNPGAYLLEQSLKLLPNSSESLKRQIYLCLEEQVMTAMQEENIR